jgi:hypothetical protein
VFLVAAIVAGGAVLTCVAFIVDHMPGSDRRSVEEHDAMIEALEEACRQRD